MSRLDKVENASTICNLFEKMKFRCDGCIWLKGQDCILPDSMHMSLYQIRNVTYEIGEFLNVPTR